MYFCLKNNKDLYLFILIIYFNYLFISYLFISNSLRSILWECTWPSFPLVSKCGELSKSRSSSSCSANITQPLYRPYSCFTENCKIYIETYERDCQSRWNVSVCMEILKLSKSQCLVIISAAASSLAANHRTRQVRAAAQDEKHADQGAYVPNSTHHHAAPSRSSAQQRASANTYHRLLSIIHFIFHLPLFVVYWSFFLFSKFRNKFNLIYPPILILWVDVTATSGAE